MKFVLVCTEGDVSEHECIKALDSGLRGQQPRAGEMFVELITIPLGGNQGHAKIIEKAETEIHLRCTDENNILSCAEPNDDIEKWIICDYDELDTSKTNLDSLKREAKETGYKLIINKPNFEFFVLALLVGVDKARQIKQSGYVKAINRAVVRLNESNIHEKGFTASMSLPMYSKKKYPSQQFFGKLMTNNPELLQEFIMSPISEDKDAYTEMRTIVLAITKAYELKLR